MGLQTTPHGPHLAYYKLLSGTQLGSVAYVRHSAQNEYSDQLVSQILMGTLI